MELSKAEKLILINQYRILSALNPDGAGNYNNRIKALEKGYKIHFDEMMNRIEDELTEEECQEIIDILEMYTSLRDSFKNLKDKKGLDKKELIFEGFDLEKEEKQLHYLEYLLYNLNRYKEFQLRSKYPNHDSEQPMLEKYRAMLKVWNILPDKKVLSKDEMNSIFNQNG